MPVLALGLALGPRGIPPRLLLAGLLFSLLPDADVLASEARWVWLPCLGLALTSITLRAFYARLSSPCRPASRRASAP